TLHGAAGRQPGRVPPRLVDQLRGRSARSPATDARHRRRQCARSEHRTSDEPVDRAREGLRRDVLPEPDARVERRTGNAAAQMENHRSIPLRPSSAGSERQYVGGAGTYALMLLSWPSASTAATPNTQSSTLACGNVYSVTLPTNSSWSQSGAHASRQKMR